MVIAAKAKRATPTVKSRLHVPEEFVSATTPKTCNPAPMLRIAMDPAGMVEGFRLKGILASGFARMMRIKDAMKSPAPATTAIHPNMSIPPAY